jgi:hypothetical protein
VTALKRGIAGAFMLGVMAAVIVVEIVATASTWPGRIALRATEALRGRLDR